MGAKMILKSGPIRPRVIHPDLLIPRTLPAIGGVRGFVFRPGSDVSWPMPTRVRLYARCGDLAFDNFKSRFRNRMDQADGRAQPVPTALYGMGPQRCAAERPRKDSVARERRSILDSFLGAAAGHFLARSGLPGRPAKWIGPLGRTAGVTWRRCLRCCHFISPSDGQTAAGMQMRSPYTPPATTAAAYLKRRMGLRKAQAVQIRTVNGPPSYPMGCLGQPGDTVPVSAAVGFSPERPDHRGRQP
jgi:hypothetical protein